MSRTERCPFKRGQDYKVPMPRLKPRGLNLVQNSKVAWDKVMVKKVTLSMQEGEPQEPGNEEAGKEKGKRARC